jgi:MFS family permease
MSEQESKSSKGVLGVILLTVFLDLVGFSIIFPLFPDMLEYYLGKEAEGGYFQALIQTLQQLSGLAGAQAEFAATVLFGGLLGSLYSALQFVAAPVWGAMSDRVGRRKVLLITVAGIAVSYLLWVCADAFWLLIASRFLGGAMAGNLSVATASIADVTDKQSRSKGMGMVGAAFGVGFIVGPALGAFLSLWDASQMFAFIPGVNPFSGPALVAFLLSVLNLVFLWKRFPETLSKESSDAANHAKRPVNPLQLLIPSKIPGVNRTNVLYFVFIAAFAGMEFTLTFLAKDRFGYSAAQNGMLFLFIGFVIALVQGGVVRRLAPKYGEKRLVIAGLLLVLPGLIVVGRCQSVGLLYAGLFLLAFGSSLVTPCLTSLVSLYSPEDRQGESLGVFRSVGSLARAFAPILGAVLYWKFGSEWPYFTSAAVLVLPLLLTFGLPLPAKDT